MEVRGAVAELRAAEAPQRREAAYQLGKAGAAARPFVPQLLAVLEDPDPRVREAGIWALGEVAAGDEDTARQAAERLLAVCRSDVRLENRHAAIRALGKLQGAAAPAVTLLIHVARGGQGERGLQVFEPTGRIRPFIEHMGLRCDAIRALGQIGDPAAVNFLVELLRTAEPAVATGYGAPYYYAGCEALAQIGVANDRVLAVLRRGTRLAGEGDVVQRAREAADTALRRLMAEP
jgi:HEAT repeat protein